MNRIEELLIKLRCHVYLVAVILSTCLYSCDSGGSSSTNANQTDMNSGSDANNNGNGDPADTLTIGGSSDGQPTGAAPIKDSVATPGVRMDSLQNSQSGSTSTNNGDNANKNGNDSNNSDSNQTDNKQESKDNGSKNN